MQADNISFNLIRPLENIPRVALCKSMELRGNEAFSTDAIHGKRVISSRWVGKYISIGKTIINSPR